MNILFVTIGQIQSLSNVSVHIDVIKALVEKGHNVTVLCTNEKKLGKPTEYVSEDGVDILRMKIGNLTGCGMIEKTLSTFLLPAQFIKGIKKYLADKTFDIVIYNTPPVTLAKVINYIKKCYGAKSYLILKDIFPQNAVDLGMMSKTGVMRLVYKYFRGEEVALYKCSDKIGCMSRANLKYLLENNSFIKNDNVEIFPNAIYQVTDAVKDKGILEKLGIDPTILTFIYGGNLGKPQGLNFLREGIKLCEGLNCQFVIIGSGSEKESLYKSLEGVTNVYCLDALPQGEYIQLCASCDIGIIMLDKRFTIPNYPSRILSYMENSMPIMACTDMVTDIKELVLDEAKCGNWCYSDDPQEFKRLCEWFLGNMDKLEKMGKNAREYLELNFVASICADRLEKFARKE